MKRLLALLAVLLVVTVLPLAAAYPGERGAVAAKGNGAGLDTAGPDIDVSPTSLSAEQRPDEITTQSLGICNVGDADLTWVLSHGEAEMPWLSEDPTSGTVVPAACTDVTATFDSTGLAAGAYAGELIIQSNDLDEPAVTVPVQLEIPFQLWLPLVMRSWPPLPAAPVLYPIGNFGADHYWLGWTPASGATSYTLEEDDNGHFTSPTTLYSGPNLTYYVEQRSLGTYYYRVRGVNSYGNGPWSNVQSATVTVGWQTLVSTDFEGTFPEPWDVVDNNGSAYGLYYWAARECRVYEGSRSGWAVGGGDGSGLSCFSNYPNNVDSWMVYGPFSLVGATDGDLSFQLWLNSEPPGDYFAASASIDGEYFYGDGYAGYSEGWQRVELDLTNVHYLGNLMGRPQVWVALIFGSDGSNNRAEGAYVDNIVLREYLGAGAPPAGLAMPALPPGVQKEAITLSLEP